MGTKQFITSLIIGFVVFTAHAAKIDSLWDDQWLLVSSNHFEIVTDLDEKAGRRLLEDLEAFYNFHTNVMGVDVVSTGRRLKIFATATPSNFNKLGLPDLVEGFFSSGSMGPAAIANVEDYAGSMKNNNYGRHVLFHEYHHFLMRFTLDTKIFPKWYDEGMADYWATFKFDGKEVSLGDPAAIMGRFGALLNGGGNVMIDSATLFRTKSLSARSKVLKDEAAVYRFYGQSFFMAHYLNSSPELRKVLADYIDYMTLGYSEEEAFAKAFKITHSQLDKDTSNYFYKMSMRVLKVKDISTTFPKADVTVDKLDKASFYAQLSDVLLRARFVEKDEVKAVFNTNIALNPTSADALLCMLIANMADDTAPLIKEVERINPTHPLLQTYKGNQLLSQARLGRIAGSDSWLTVAKQARGYFRRAIHTDPALPLPYFGLGEVYELLPDTEPLREGIEGFDTATLYRRSARNFAALADLYLRTDQQEAALSALRATVATADDQDYAHYSLILENLELLNDARSTATEARPSELVYTDGSRYAGSVIDGKPDAVGKLTRPNGSYYEGSFEKGVMHGKGKLVTHSGFSYEGDFQHGIAKGNASISYPADNTVKTYEGEVNYAVPSGKGVMTMKSGIYTGEFRNGLQHGEGVFASNDRKILLNGHWVNDRFRWPEMDGIQFSGYVSDGGGRDGLGVCATKANAQLAWCRYKDNVLVKPDKDDD